MNSFDAMGVGAGIWGCTLTRRLAVAGHKVLVLEKRAAVGGISGATPIDFAARV